jgi:hypothetical protein
MKTSNVVSITAPFRFYMVRRGRKDSKARTAP